MHVIQTSTPVRNYCNTTPLLLSLTRISRFLVARDLFSKLKPDRDSKVANRLINHALGIRPKVVKKKPEVVAAEEKQETVVDAWDD